MPNQFSKEDRDLLIRLDERLKDVRDTLTDLKEQQSQDIDNIKKNYVTKEEFSLVQKLVYAAVGFILTGALGLVGTLLTSIFNKGLPH